MNIADLEVIPPAANNGNDDEDAANVQWYYYLQNDPQRMKPDGWYEYDTHLNLAVEQLFQISTRVTRAQTASNGNQYELDFQNMTQRNTTTGKERPIFRTINGRPPQGPPGETVEEETTIFDLITSHDWAAVEALLEFDPKQAKQIHTTSGRSPLHMICSFGSSPPHLIRVAAAAAPAMLKVSDKVYQDTPLHIVCRNSQKTRSKAEILLEFCEKDDVLRRNLIGGTCLHSACGHNAMFVVLEGIVKKNPAVLKVSTFDGIPPIRGLFFSYTQSIPGVLAVGKLLKGREVTEGHFDRFWQKADFIALEYYKLTQVCPQGIKITNDYVAHGLIHSNAPLNLLKIALKRDANCAAALDRHGNTPLHLLVERRPYRLKEREALQACLEANPEMAGLPNSEGHPPLLLAIRNKIPWQNGVGDILTADMTVISRRDAETELMPFQLAASVGGPEALNTTFQLLSALPQVIGF